MGLQGRREHNFFGYGIEPLIEDFDADSEDEYALIERVRTHGTIATDTEGSVLATGDKRWYGYYGTSHGDAHKFTYEEWVAQQDAKPSPKEQERAELIQHWKELKAQKDRAKQDHELYERRLAQSNMGLRSWATRQEQNQFIHETNEKLDQLWWAEELSRQSAQALAESRQREEERRRQADEEHERQKQWALSTSTVEKRIVEITNGIDCNGSDRTMMRAMLRYQNLGPGVGQRWDTDKFTNS